ncbi:MAG: ATP synthase F1 subunit delta, partial [Acidimicrobiales bacterium]
GVLVDAAVDRDAKAQLLSTIFGQRIPMASLALAEAVVTEEASRFVFDTFTQVETVLDGSYVSVWSGFEGTRRRIEGYVTGRLRLSSVDEIEQFEREIQNVRSVVDTSGVLRRFLAGSQTAPAQRREVIGEICGDKVGALTLEVLSRAVSIVRIRDFSSMLEIIARIAADERGRKTADVRSARALTSSQIESLAVSLARLVGRQVEIYPRTDTSLIAGVVAVVGDRVFDGTARRRLDEVREQIGLAAAR